MLAPHRKSFFHRVYFKIRNLLLSWLRGVPDRVLYAAPPAYLNLVNLTALRWKPDMTVINYWYLYKLSRMIAGGRKVLLTHDLDFLKYAEEEDRSGSRPADIISGRRYRRQTELELSAYRCFRRIITVTESEADELKRFLKEPDKIVRTLPMAMDLKLFDTESGMREKNLILFMGVFYSDFNSDALSYFMEDIFVEIISRMPEARLDIVGPGADPEVAASYGEKVTVLGRVGDIRDYLRRASVMVLPLRFAAGVRIRMLEAAAAGLPVVSTSTGVRGLDITSGEEYIEADEPVEFAESVVRILEDEELAERIGRGARKWAEDRISISSYPERLGIMLKALMQ
jgi:glycosyltransferase involved in cell wall biosynthesis